MHAAAQIDGPCADSSKFQHYRSVHSCKLADDCASFKFQLQFRRVVNSSPTSVLATSVTPCLPTISGWTSACVCRVYGDVSVQIHLNLSHERTRATMDHTGRSGQRQTEQNVSPPLWAADTVDLATTLLAHPRLGPHLRHFIRNFNRHPEK